MKVIFYTRFENDTGGDETKLKFFTPEIIENIEQGSEINLIINCDDKSMLRAEKMELYWKNLMKSKGFIGNVWLFNPPSNRTRLSSLNEKTIVYNRIGIKDQEEKNITPYVQDNPKEKMKNWKQIQTLLKQTDLFVFAGWTHQLNHLSAKYFSDQFKVPTTSKILLCTSPGLCIDKNEFLTHLKKKYTNVYSLQFGVGEKAGLAVNTTLTRESIEENIVREAWISHLSKPENNFADYQKYLGDGSINSDKLAVIYCSKDKPGIKGTEFIEALSLKVEEKERANYTVILVGADKTSEAYRLWQDLCSVYGFSVKVIPRTENSKTLMRGLRDAEHAMATGVWSILEARFLGINCKYLCPDHLEVLGTMLQDSKPADLEEAFEAGKQTLAELRCVASEGYKPQILDPSNARSRPLQEDKAAWQEYLESSERRRASRADYTARFTSTKSENESSNLFETSCSV